MTNMATEDVETKTTAIGRPDHLSHERAKRSLARLMAEGDAAQVRLDDLTRRVDIADRQLTGLHAAETQKQHDLVETARRAQANADSCEEALKEAEKSTEIDALTELPNRAVLLDRLTIAMANAKRHGLRCALLFVDLNNFKDINDTQGHAAGDAALQRAAACLKASVREVDTVSRHGGDEFLILLPEVSRAEDAVIVAEKIVAALSGLKPPKAPLVQLSASIGISVYPENGADAPTLIERADAAMYVAKRQGLSSFVSTAGALPPSNDRAQ